MTRINLQIIFIFFSLTINSSGTTGYSATFSRSLFYKAMASESIEIIDAQLKNISLAAIDKIDAYEGALLMKKAGLVSNLSDKLHFFKTGHSKLESSIAKDTSDVELRFLRLIIQENTPRIVNYKSDLEKDNHIVQSNFRNLDAEVQKAVLDYRKNSKYLSKIVF